MYKYVNGLLAAVMNELYTCNSYMHEYYTRQRHLLHTNRSKTIVFMNSFTNVNPQIWNLNNLIGQTKYGIMQGNALQKSININVSIYIEVILLSSYWGNIIEECL